MSEASMRQIAEITRRVAEGELSRQALQVLINRGAPLGFPLLYDEVLEEARREARKETPHYGSNESRSIFKGRAFAAIAAASREESDWAEARACLSMVHSPQNQIGLLAAIAKASGEQREVDALQAMLADSKEELRMGTYQLLRLAQEAVDDDNERIIIHLRPYSRFQDDYDTMVSLLFAYRDAHSETNFDEPFRRAEGIENKKYREKALIAGMCSLARCLLPRALKLYAALESSFVKNEIATAIAGALAAEGSFAGARETAREAFYIPSLVSAFLAIAVSSEDHRDFDQALEYARKLSSQHGDAMRAMAFAEVAGALKEVISKN
ncbi:hypothetical protein IID24_05860 [Patescibacteria group bacterium]|nr:hypothetical protein [Patescibacteria group bacterium]